MNDNQTAEKALVIENLDSAVSAASPSITIDYFSETDMVRIRHTDGFSVCISAEGKNALGLLYETLHELKPFLQYALSEAGWQTSFGKIARFHARRFINERK